MSTRHDVASKVLEFFIRNVLHKCYWNSKAVPPLSLSMTLEFHRGLTSKLKAIDRRRKAAQLADPRRKPPSNRDWLYLGLAILYLIIVVARAC